MKCPGQDPRYWKFDAIFEVDCPNCGASTEFFKDETRRRCSRCGKRVLNPKMDFGCAAHCKFAEQCFGELPPELIKEKEDLFKDRVAVETKRRLGRDFKRIAHAARAARYAERILIDEKGDPAIAISASYLTALTNASDSDRTDAAREVLVHLEAQEPLIEEVCEIIESANDVTSDAGTNKKAVHDAEILARLEEQTRKGSMTAEDALRDAEHHLLTRTALDIAQEIFSDRNQETEQTTE